MKNLKSNLLIIPAIIFIGFLFAFMVNKEPSANSAANLKDAAAIEHLRQTGEYDSLAAAMRAARYQIQTDQSELTASNNANDLQAKFSGDGLRLQVTADEKSA